MTSTTHEAYLYPAAFLATPGTELVSSVLIISVVLLIAAIVLGLLYIRKLRKNLLGELSDVIHRISDGLFIIDRDFRFTYVNEQAAKMVQQDHREMIGKSIYELFPAVVDSPTQRALIEALNQQHYVRQMDYYPPPLDLWYENHIYPTRDGLSVFTRDVTKEMQAEEKLQKSERLYRSIASNIPGSAICLLDPEYRYILIEGDLVTKLGYSKELLFGRKANEVIPQTRFNEVEPHFKRAFNGETFSIEVHRNEYDMVSRYVPLRNEHNEIYAIMIVMIDVTALKEVEKKTAGLNAWLENKITERTKQLELANKELESFTYSVAHDLRAPLRGMSGYSGMLAEDYADKLDERGQHLLNEIRSNARRMDTLIEDLLHFSKLGKKEVRKTLIDMNLLIQEIIDEMKTGSATIKIEQTIPVFGDPGLMKSVVVNLLSNAIKYSSKRDHPEIAIASTESEGMTTYSIADNGVGFDMKYAKDLFGVFQRLHSHDEFEGTGVGLAIVQRIINKHGGNVWAYSKKNEGATFYFTLPAVPPEYSNEFHQHDEKR